MISDSLASFGCGVDVSARRGLLGGVLTSQPLRQLE